MAWNNQPMVLHHGTSETFARQINTGGVALASCKALDRDFGKGFYLTERVEQAITWARFKVVRNGELPAVVTFQVDRNDLARLDFVTFLSSLQEILL